MSKADKRENIIMVSLGYPMLALPPLMAIQIASEPLTFEKGKDVELFVALSMTN